MEIKKIEWNGLQAVQVDHGDAVMVVVTEFGPRIAHYGLKGQRNLLFWDSGERHRKEWYLRGGHRVWIMTSGADESETTYRPDNEPCKMEISTDRLTVAGALDGVNMSLKGIRIEPEGDDLAVTSFAENAGDLLMSCGVWVLTCTLPDERTAYRFPIGDGSGWDTFKSVQFRKWGSCGGSFGDSQFAVSSEELTVNPEGREAKLMFCGPCGEGEMVSEAGVFKKTISYDPSGSYPEGCNWAVYIGPENYMVEFESMGPIVSLKPGMRQEHRELWSLKKNG